MERSWKDMFTFSRKEQGGITALLLIILILIILNPLIPLLVPEDKEDMESFRQQAELFIKEMERLDNLTESQAKNRTKVNTSTQSLEQFLENPYPFDPNELTEEAWLKMGMESFAARNIVNYRKKGGEFRTVKDLEKIYGMKQEWLDAVSPFIQIKKEKTAMPPLEIQESSYKKKGDDLKIIEKEFIPVELNAADSSDLTRCSGIGPAFSKRIVSYRELLGGFYDIQQLLEVYGMDTMRYRQIEHQVSTNPGTIRKIDINTIGFKDLLKHPYFEYYLVKAIFNYKDGKGRIDSVQELKGLPEMYPELYEKISPYLEAREPTEK